MNETQQQQQLAMIVKFQ